MLEFTRYGSHNFWRIKDYFWKLDFSWTFMLKLLETLFVKLLSTTHDLPVDTFTELLGGSSEKNILHFGEFFPCRCTLKSIQAIWWTWPKNGCISETTRATGGPLVPKRQGGNVAAAIVAALLNGISTLLEYPYTPEKWSIETPVKFWFRNTPGNLR